MTGQSNVNQSIIIPGFPISTTCKSNQQQQSRDGRPIPFGIQELDDEVVLDDVHLLDCRDGVDPYPLERERERALQPLVIRGVYLLDNLLLPSKYGQSRQEVVVSSSRSRACHEHLAALPAGVGSR
jgi:hypothetical protein